MSFIIIMIFAVLADGIVEAYGWTGFFIGFAIALVLSALSNAYEARN